MGCFPFTLFRRSSNDVQRTNPGPGTPSKRSSPPSLTPAMAAGRKDVGGDIISGQSRLRDFTYAELKSATRNFQNLVGEGGFGHVYKGWLDGGGQVVAVKQLDREGMQGHKEWLVEVNMLGLLHHPNLVNLIGYCSEGDQRLLVYEFMPRGSLENHLFRRNAVCLPWQIRMKVALGAAKGLAYLHEENPPVIYRDFKTSNILLDSDFTPKLSDFGLAKEGPVGDKTHVSTRVMGTHGYAAPEYVMTGHLTSMSDVFSFGVVLLEMLTGRKSMDKNRPSGEQNLVEWAKPLIQEKRRLFRLMDPRLEGQYSVKGAQKAATLAQHCLSRDPRMRPQMCDVVLTLSTLQDLTDYANLMPSIAQGPPGYVIDRNGYSKRPPGPGPRSPYPGGPVARDHHNMGHSPHAIPGGGMPQRGRV